MSNRRKKSAEQIVKEKNLYNNESMYDKDKYMPPKDLLINLSLIAETQLKDNNLDEHYMHMDILVEDNIRKMYARKLKSEYTKYKKIFPSTKNESTGVVGADMTIDEFCNYKQLFKNSSKFLEHKLFNYHLKQLGLCEVYNMGLLYDYTKKIEALMNKTSEVK